MLPLSFQANAADSAAASFNQLFGKDSREVRQTRQTDDDAEFARRLLSEARSAKHAEDLTILLYEKAHEFGLRDVKGYPTAKAALDELLKKDPSKKFEIGEMRQLLGEKWYAAEPDTRLIDFENLIDMTIDLSREAAEAGEVDLALKFLRRVNSFASRLDSPRKHDVRDEITGLVRMRRSLDEIAKLEEQLAADPTAADKLAMIYLADLDDIKMAATYIDRMTDKALATQVRLASTDFDDATPEQANEAGVFYFELVKASKTQQPVEMLIRARVWLTEYLSREQGEAEVIKAADALLGEVNQALLQRGVGRKLARKMSARVRGDGQFGRPAKVQAAIDKGVEWLYTQRNANTHWEQGQPSHHNYGGYTALVVYALLMADEDPQLNSGLSRSVHFMMNADMKGTYPICFRIHAWEVLPHRERYRPVLVRDVTRLRGGATRHGYWGYTMTGKGVDPNSRLDTSTTLAGGLGLWIGEEVGGITAKKVYWERIARGLVKHQLADNGWCYNPATGQTGQGAMTAGALALLHASYPHLSDATKLHVDKAIEKGMKWMDENFSATTHVNRGGFKNYYFAAVQHAGLFSGRRQFKEIDWYESICEHLIKTQSNHGAWGSVEETAFAIAFLCRGGIVYESSSSEKQAEEATPASNATDEAEDEITESDLVEVPVE